MTRPRRFGGSRLLAVLGLFALLVAACGEEEGPGTTPSPTGTGSPQETVRIAFFAPQANSYVAATLAGIQQVAQEQGAEVTVFDTEFDTTKEFNQIQDATASGNFDAFIIIPLDPVALVPAAEEAIEAGIAVVNTDLALGPDLTTSEPQVEGQAGSVLTPGTIRADSITQLLIEACDGVDPCNVGWIAGVATIDFEQKIKERLDQIVAENDHIKLLAYQDGGGYLADPAIPIAQNILQANPDLNVLATSGDQMTLGAEIAVEDAGLAPGEDIALIGGGASCPGVQKVLEGRWFGTTLDVPRDEGVLGAQLAIQWARGEITEAAGVDAQAESGFPRVLTAQAVNDSGFECQWEG